MNIKKINTIFDSIFSDYGTILKLEDFESFLKKIMINNLSQTTYLLNFEVKNVISKKISNLPITQIDFTIDELFQCINKLNSQSKNIKYVYDDRTNGKGENITIFVSEIIASFNSDVIHNMDLNELLIFSINMYMRTCGGYIIFFGKPSKFGLKLGNKIQKEVCPNLSIKEINNFINLTKSKINHHGSFYDTLKKILFYIKNTY